MNAYIAQIPELTTRVLELSYASYCSLSHAIVPTFVQLATRVTSLWQASLPYLEVLYLFLGSKLGLSLQLIGAAIIPATCSTFARSNLASVALLFTSIVLAAAGGYLLRTEGLVPAQAGINYLRSLIFPSAIQGFSTMFLR